MVKCPYCNTYATFIFLKIWRFRFYTVRRLQCGNCKGIINHYSGVSPKGKEIEFIIKVKPGAKVSD